MIKVLAACIGNIVCVDTATPQNERQQSVNRASTERQRFCVLHLVQSKGWVTAFAPNRSIGSLYRQYRVSILLHHKMSVNRASTEHQQSVSRASTPRQQSVNRVLTILGVASCIIQRLCYSIYAWSTYWQPLWAKEKSTWSQPQSENQRQQSVNNYGCCILNNPRAVLQHLPIIEVLASFIDNMVCVNATTPQASMEPPQLLVMWIR